jgi:type I restriction enzyme S subunit
MGLSKLGEYIQQSDLRNTGGAFGINDVRGISIQKRFIDTKADMTGVSLAPYLVVPQGYFVYVSVTSRNSEKVTIAHNTSDETYIVSSSYVVFHVTDTDALLPDYLFMYFNRPEFDRYARFNSWGSAREVFSWSDMCDIEIDLPPLHIQQKYVDVYNAMLANQRAYERGLEDLKLTCDAFIEQLRKNMPLTEIASYIEAIDEKNEDGKVTLAQGVNVDKQFIPAKRIADDFESARIVREGQFAYNKVMKANGTKLPIALRVGETCYVSGSYQVFQVYRKDALISEYLMMWLERTETQRYAGFISWGSTRDILQYETLGEVKIPIPSIEIQQSIVNIYNVYITRREINEKLKAQIKSICPILIKGSLEEANQ